MTKRAIDFLKKISEFDALCEEIEALCVQEDEHDAKTALFCLAQKEGFSLSEADFAQNDGELAEEDLLAVVGGSNMMLDKFSKSTLDRIIAIASGAP